MTADPRRDALIALAGRVDDLGDATARVHAAAVLGQPPDALFRPPDRRHLADAWDEVVGTTRDLNDGLLDPLTVLGDGWSAPDADADARRILTGLRDQALDRLLGGTP